MNRLSKGDHHCRHLQASWDKHGGEHFVFAVVEECAVEALSDREIFHCAALPESQRFHQGPAGEHNATRGVPKTDEHRLKFSRSMGGRAVRATSIVGQETLNFIMLQDVVAAGFSQPKASEALRTGLAYRGYLWTRVGEVVEKKPKEPKQQKDKRHRVVLGTPLGGGPAVPFSGVAATRAAGFIPSGVSKCLGGVMAQHNGYTWAYADGLPHKTMSGEKKAQLRGVRPRGGSRPVVGTDAAGVETTYPYVAEAARCVGCDPATIHHCLAGKMKKAGGRTWRLS